MCGQFFISVVGKAVIGSLGLISICCPLSQPLNWPYTGLTPTHLSHMMTQVWHLSQEPARNNGNHTHVSLYPSRGLELACSLSLLNKVGGSGNQATESFYTQLNRPSSLLVMCCELWAASLQGCPVGFLEPKYELSILKEKKITLLIQVHSDFGRKV